MNNCTAIIEMPKRTKHKYEVNKVTGILTLDRPLDLAIPENYGYVPNTLAEDGDPLDIFVICDDPIIPLVEVKVKVISLLRCIDKGVEDHKLIATVYKDKKYEEDLIPLDSIIHYLRNYKSDFIVQTLCSKKEALEVLEKAQVAYDSARSK